MAHLDLKRGHDQEQTSKIMNRICRWYGSFIYFVTILDISKRPKLNSEICFFGPQCIRRNPHHFRQYEHPHLRDLCLKYQNNIPKSSDLDDFEVDPDIILDQIKIYKDICKDKIKADSESEKAKKPEEPELEKSKDKPKKTFIEHKMELSRPYGLFLTKVENSESTHRSTDSIYMTDLLHPAMGKLKKSLQINFMVDWEWLKMNYEVTKNEVIGNYTY